MLVSFVFLHPFGLAHPYSSSCHESQLDRVRAKLGNRTKVYTARDVSRRLPFHVSQAAVIAPFTGLSADNPLVTFPIEHTPLYVGIFPGHSGESARPYEAIGDVIVEAFAWPSKAVGPIQGEEVAVRRTSTLINTGQLGQWTGIATAYLADFQILGAADKWPRCVIAAGEKLLPHAPLWTPLLTGRGGVPVTRTLPVGDSGVYDDLGHIPLLRRRIPRIALFDSSALHDNSTGVDMPNLCQMVYLLAAFGQPGCLNPPNPAGSPNLKMRPGTMTTFEPSEFGPLWEALQAKRAAGEPAVIRGRYTVVDNSLLGIKGGWQVDVVWVFFMPSQSWRAALPPSTNSGLQSYFPNYMAGEMKSRMEMSAASQFASWVAKTEAIPMIRVMLQEEGVATPAEDRNAEVVV